MKKHEIVILYGGQSSEHEPTRISFAFLHSRIKEKGLRSDLKASYVVFITKSGKAILSKFSTNKKPVDFEVGKEISLVDAFKFIKEKDLFVYAILYGQNGEDGKIQGMVNFFSIDSNLGSVLSCAIGMSKYHLNKYIKSNFKIQIPETIGLRSTNNLENDLKIFEGVEVVIKPNSLGSSVLTEKFIYVSKNLKKIKSHIGKILKLDSLALVQKYIKGEEYSISCLEKNGEVLVLPAIKIVTKDNFFGQKEKFIAGNCEEIIINESNDAILLKLAKKISKEIFIDLFFQNAARFDLIISNNKVYFLEINPLPGVLRNSILTRALRTKGWDLEDLVAITYDNEKNRAKTDTEFSFKVDF